MTDDIDTRLEVTETTDWVELDPSPVCPKNGKAMTNGKVLPNGRGLTSGPGMVNGTALTSQTLQRDGERRPEGFHLYPGEVSRKWADWMPHGIGVKRDLINGFSMEAERRAQFHPRRRWFLGRRKGDWKGRMEELAASPMPGEDIS
jgi:hypothetical protein